MAELVFVALAASAVETTGGVGATDAAVVANIRDYSLVSVPEHCFALMLALRRNLVAYRADVEAGLWQASSRFCLLDHPITDLAGSKLGIVGYGALGRKVAALGRAFGMDICVTARSNVPDTDVTQMPLDELLRTCDVVTLHLPLSDSTRHMIGAAELATMKLGAVLINTARGGLVDEAALVAAAMLRKNPDAVVLPFEHSVVKCGLDAHGSVMENAARLAAIGGGGTNCSAPLLRMNSKQELADLVIYVSDNESWIDAKRSGATATMGQWKVFKQRNPQAKLVCIDIAPHATTQAMECEDILNIGGFSDDVFKIIAAFAAGQLQAEHWVGEIAAIDMLEGC